MKKFGILTGGGDCPGLNGVIRAVVQRAESAGIKTIGFLEGWRGAIQNLTTPLSIKNTYDILQKGGTILGSSRTNPYKNSEDVKKVKKTLNANAIDALIAVGGDDTLGVAARLYRDEEIGVVGVPKTIDNDLPATEYTFGFDTAVNVAMDAIDRLRTTAESHRRIIVVEAMGRHAGWIAAAVGIAVSADAVLVPEKPIDLDAVAKIVKKNRKMGKLYNIVVVAEGATWGEGGGVTKTERLDAFGHVYLGGIAEQIASALEEKTGYEVRSAVLGHVQRGGSPTAFDRILSTRYGLKAAELAIKGDFGKMVILKSNEIKTVEIEKVLGGIKTLSDDMLGVIEAFSGV